MQIITTSDAIGQLEAALKLAEARRAAGRHLEQGREVAKAFDLGEPLVHGGDVDALDHSVAAAER